VEEKPIPKLHLMFGGEVVDQFDVRFVSSRELSAENFDDYKSIMLVGLNDISSGLAEKLQAHLKDGRSILFFPGEEMNLANVNAFFQSVNIGSFGRLMQNEVGQMAGGVDLDHPVFEGVFLKKSAGKKFDAPMAYKYYELKPLNAVEQNVILRLNESNPILLESKPESGLFYTFALNPAESWTDLTIKTSGLALMVQLARMMNQTQRVEAVMDLGSSNTVRIKTESEEVIQLRSSDGVEATPEQFPQSGYVVLKFDKLNIVEGNYELVQNGQVLEKISFNVPDTESQLAARSEQEIRDLLDNTGNGNIHVNEAIRGAFAEEIKTRSEGVPLWKYFLLAALAFLIAEFLILRVGVKTVSN
jgi:hypothetical protein